jgi:putative acetyltransferase
MKPRPKEPQLVSTVRENAPPMLREYAPRDRDAVVALIDRVYSEYGERLCLENADRDLLKVPSFYGNGNFLVLEADGGVVGSVAVALKEGPVCALKRLYLDSGFRGHDWSRHMLFWAMDRGRACGKRRMELWSDTRFTRAHAFYVKHGFRFDGRIRTMHDNYAPYDEFYFDIDL